MSILFVLENYYPKVGGVETLFKLLCERLVREGSRVKVVTTRYKGLPKNEVINGVEIRRVTVFTRYLFTFFAFPVIFKNLKSFDFIHTTSYNAGFPGYFAAKLAGKKIVITFHEVWGRLWFDLPFMPSLSKWGHYLYEQLLLKLPFDHFIAVSNATRQRLIENGISEEKIAVNYNGLDYSEFENVDPATKEEGIFTYTYFGRLGISKGLDLILEAAAGFRKIHPHSKLVLILPTSPRNLFRKIKLRIKVLGLDDYVEWLHHLPFNELKRTIKASDCVVVPSYSEGFCFAAVESIALGVPVISSGKAALTEVISGKFIEMESHDTPGLVNALEKAISGEWTETPVRYFHIEDNINRYLELYQKL